MQHVVQVWPPVNGCEWPRLVEAAFKVTVKLGEAGECMLIHQAPELLDILLSDGGIGWT